MFKSDFLDKVIRKGHYSQKKSSEEILIVFDTRNNRAANKTKFFGGKYLYYFINPTSIVEGDISAKIRHSGTRRYVAINITYRLKAIKGREKDIVNALHDTLSCSNIFNNKLQLIIKKFDSEISYWHSKKLESNKELNINNINDFLSILKENLSEALAKIIEKEIGFEFNILNISFKDLFRLGTRKIDSSEFSVRLKEFHSALIMKYQAILEVSDKDGMFALVNQNESDDFEELIQNEIEKYLLSNSLDFLVAYSASNEFEDLIDKINKVLISRQLGWKLLQLLLITDVDALGQIEVIKIPVLPKVNNSLTSMILFKARLRVLNLPESSNKPIKEILVQVSEIFRDIVSDILEVQPENQLSFSNVDEKELTSGLLTPAIEKVKKELGLIVRIINFSRELTEEQVSERKRNQAILNRMTTYAQNFVDLKFDQLEDLQKKENQLILKGYEEDDEELKNVRGHIEKLTAELKKSNAIPQIEYKPIKQLNNADDLKDELSGRDDFTHNNEPPKEIGRNNPVSLNENSGILLQSIPPKMQVHNIHRCIIRIGLDEKKIIENLPKKVSNKIVRKGIRIEEVMEVIFLPNEYFEIFPINSPRQIVEPQDYTEWNFDVKPILLGEFPLTFKVSVILEKGIKEIVLRETISVVVERVQTSEIFIQSNPVSIEYKEKNMNEIKIFLASSSELSEDRKDFEIFINRKNKLYSKKGKFLKLVQWEDFQDSLSKTRLQDEYNKAIIECDIFVSLYNTKVGKYTEEEFLVALESFKKNGKPLIYTYFKDTAINMSKINQEIIGLLNFKQKLSDLGHFYTTYSDISDLRYKFNEQLLKLLTDK